MGEITTANQDAMLSIIEKVALDPNADVLKMEKMLDMQERIFDKNAEISFNKAMVACQEAMPVVTADANNTQTNSKYARFETLLKEIKPVYTSHGFSLSFGEIPTDKQDHICVSCDVLHSDGYSKQYQSTLPIDTKGIKGSVNKTGIHGTASAYSYAKRYLVTMIFNIAIQDQDDDGVSAGGVTIENLLEHNAAVRELFDSISAIKTGIAIDDLSTAAEAWFTLDDNQKSSIWKAPSYGGVFTTREREIMKSREFRVSYYGDVA